MHKEGADGIFGQVLRPNREHGHGLKLAAVFTIMRKSNNKASDMTKAEFVKKLVYKSSIYLTPCPSGADFYAASSPSLGVPLGRHSRKTWFGVLPFMLRP